MKTSFIVAASSIIGIAAGSKIQEIRKKKLEKEIEKLNKELEEELTKLLEG